MVWDPSHPAEDSAVVSAPLRDNFAVLDTALIAPLTALANGQLLVKAAGPVLAGVTPGTNGWVLTLVGGVPTWVILPVDPGFANPLTTFGDLIVAAGGGAPGRLGIGGNGSILQVTAGTVGWSALVTALGDLIVGNASGQPSVLPVSTNGYVLTLVSGAPSWQAVPVDPGFASPMTSLGDLIVGAASGTPARLGIGTTGHVLTVAAGTPTWAAPTGSGGGGVSAFRLPLEQATLPDGTTGNVPPELVREKSTGTFSGAPSPTRTYARFAGDAAAVAESLLWSFILPSNWGSGGTLRLKWKAAAATTGTVIWKAGACAITEGSTDDDAVAFTAATAATASTAPATQGQSAEVTIAMTTTGFAANRWVTVFVARDPVADTMTGTGTAGDAILMGVQFEYTAA